MTIKTKRTLNGRRYVTKSEKEERKAKLLDWLHASEVEGGFTKLWRVVYCKTAFDKFYYGQAIAKKIVWRFYWITPFKDNLG